MLDHVKGTLHFGTEKVQVLKNLECDGGQFCNRKRATRGQPFPAVSFHNKQKTKFHTNSLFIKFKTHNYYSFIQNSEAPFRHFPQTRGSEWPHRNPSHPYNWAPLILAIQPTIPIFSCRNPSEWPTSKSHCIMVR